MLQGPRTGQGKQERADKKEKQAEKGVKGVASQRTQAQGRRLSQILWLNAYSNKFLSCFCRLFIAVVVVAAAVVVRII